MQIQHSEFQDQLVRGLSHKMNNILSLFHGYLSLLLDDKKLDPELQNGLTRIKEGADAASELMDRTQALARPTSVVWREVDLCNFLPMLRASFESYAERGVKIRIDLPEKLPSVWTDASRLRAALTEIVRNACEASPRNGSVEIAVRAEHTEAAPAPNSSAQSIPWVSITITDHGAGIPAEIAGRVFDPFFSTKQKRNATGLGLTTSMGLIQQLGGYLRFESKPGRTIFHILLPSRAVQF